MTTATAHAPDALATLKANLQAIAGRSARVAQAIGKAAPAPGIEFVQTPEGSLSGRLDGRALASMRRPLDEGARLAATIDDERAGAVVVLGFGLGYHARALAERLGRDTVLVIFEPDVALLRAVFERIDHSAWLASTNVVFCTDPANTPALGRTMEGLEPLVALGVRFLEHPASRARLGPDARRFAESFTQVIASMRTHIVTTMVQSDTTARNNLMNLDHYCTCGGVGELEGVADGFPAIVVSAGPSLRRNIQLLRDPGVRDRCVIIAVQTVLRQLLDMGVKPHFVTALDYHEISKRFYEGLSAEDVEGVTLVAEPKCNPAILDAFPGAIRMVEAEYLSRVLGEELAPRHGRLQPGATVAHLAYYLARHLGCDPVVLIGQDLAFTDGQYYAAGAAIHDVWAPELNPFNTLEMMEWQRIVRMRGHLHERRDHLDRRVYTDDQMATYLAQFERDFAADAERGLRTIDATEGGVRKEETEIATLEETLADLACRNAPTIPHFPAAERQRDEAHLIRVRERIRSLQRDARFISEQSRRTEKLLLEMPDLLGQPNRVNKLIDETHRIRDRVEKRDVAFELIQRLNQTGSFKRYRADRAIRLAGDLNETEEQRRRIERDAVNVRWVGDVADAFASMLRDTAEMLRGGPKRTRDVLPPADALDDAETRRGRAVSIAAVICATIDPWNTANAETIRRTLERLAACREIEQAIVLTPEAQSLRAAFPERIGRMKIVIEHEPAAPEAMRMGIRAARLWSSTCWRGGVANLTIFDECLDARAIRRAMERHRLDGALVVGPDWTMLDAALCDEIVERHREDPTSHAIAFSQAPPGLAGCALARQLVEALAEGQESDALFATAGGVLGYTPRRSRTDPIGTSACVQIDPPIRNLMHRFTGEMRHADNARDLVETLNAADPIALHPTPAEVILRIADGPSTIDHAVAHRLADLASPRTGLTIEGTPDPLDHPEWIELVRAARDAGFGGIHIRTTLRCDAGTVDALLELGIDVISVPMPGDQPESWPGPDGRAAHSRVIDNLERLANGRTLCRGVAHPWIVPRITRRDEVLEEIETFFDRWLLLVGACVIDQPPAPIPGDRIEPLGKPRSTAVRDERHRMLVLPDGRVPISELEPERESAGNVLEQDPAGVWRALLARREQSRPPQRDAPLRTGW